MPSNLKISIPTIGTRGDIQPYIALSLALQQAGHIPVVASHPCMRALVESYGIEFKPFGPDIDIAAETAHMRANSRHWLIGFQRVMRFSFEILEKSHPDLLELCDPADLVIVTHTAAGSIEADQLERPTVSVTLIPEAIPAEDPDASFFNRAVMKAAGAGMSFMMSRPMNNIRKSLGMPPMGPSGITSPVLNLIPLSPAVSAPNPLWENRHRMTGYWFTPPPTDWEPPAGLYKFLAEGEPPVVISLGAMAISGEDALEAASITLEAIRRAEVRAIIQGWNEPMTRMDIPETIFHAGPVPHDWLLERASGIVHHGGFGTTAAGFKAGIPALVIPHIIDQYIWGRKVEELGAGPEAIPRSKLNPISMASALKRMQEQELRANAAELGETIRNEPDGCSIAVQLIEERMKIRSS